MRGVGPGTRDAGLTVLLSVEAGARWRCGSGSTAWLVRQAKRVARRAGVSRGELSVVLVGDGRMRRAHAEHLGDETTTDVITFDLSDGPGGGMQGDLIVCVDEARRQAAARGHSLRLEVLLYIVHGMMHLLGHDDHDPAAAAAMHRREDELLRGAGLGGVYGRRRRKR